MIGRPHSPAAGDHEVRLRPSPVAMVWGEPGSPHQAIAVPGVDLHDGEALVEVELATICGSDVHTVRGDRSAPTPLVLGHEQVGRIVALATGGVVATDGTALSAGDRVVWSVTASCGVCDRCRAGIPQKCRHVTKYGHERLARGWELSGGFATHVQVRAGTSIVRVPGAMPAALAAPAACSTATAVAALDAASRLPLDGTTVLVAGAGMIGLAATAMAADAGANVVVVDPDAGRRSTALAFGAVLVHDPGAGSAVEELRHHDLDDPLVAIEASGSPASVHAALRSVDVGGIVVLVGSVSPGPAVEIDPEAVVRGLLTVTGVHNYAPTHLQDAIEFLATSRRAQAFEALVGAMYGLNELDTALADAATGVHVRVGVCPLRLPFGSTSAMG